jgi:hypothetical protein
MSLPAPVTVAGFAPLALVAKVTVTTAGLAALKVMVFWVAVPSATLTGEPMLTTGASLVKMVFCTVATPKVALVGALMPKLKVSANSAVVSSTVAVRTKTLVTPAGIVMMPVAGTGMKVVPPSVE